jgi:hypothetical protein
MANCLGTPRTLGACEVICSGEFAVKRNFTNNFPPLPVAGRQIQFGKKVIIYYSASVTAQNHINISESRLQETLAVQEYRERPAGVSHIKLKVKDKTMTEDTGGINITVLPASLHKISQTF